MNRRAFLKVLGVTVAGLAVHPVKTIKYISKKGVKTSINDLQSQMDFLYSSHIDNVRKAINDIMIIDPYVISMKDLKGEGLMGYLKNRRWP